MNNPKVSPDVSVFWKPLRRLLEEGRPADSVTVLYYNIRAGYRLPFASLAKTRGNRLIFWPACDANAGGSFSDGAWCPIDHLSLELANDRTHITYRLPEAQRGHVERGWLLKPWADGRLKFWLTYVCKASALEAQAGALEQLVRMPTTDSARRREEYARYFNALKHQDVQNTPMEGDYFITSFFLLNNPNSFYGPLLPEHFPSDQISSDIIEETVPGERFPVVPTGINVGGETF